MIRNKQLPGSIFNHSTFPNVSYTIDYDQGCIRFSTTRPIAPDEELCIFYGSKLWFQDTAVVDPEGDSGGELTTEEAWNTLSAVAVEQFCESEGVVMEVDLPFEKLKVSGLNDEEEEATSGEIKTGTNFLQISANFS